MSVAALVVAVVALLLSTGFLLTVLAAVWFFDRYDREPVGLVAAVFLWGAVVVPVLALLVEGVGAGFLGAVGSGPWVRWAGSVVVAPGVEEILKGVAILGVILLSDQFDNPTDGVVYGTAVGLGFALTENSLYALGALGGGPVQVGALVLVRTLTSAGVHAVASAALGGILGMAYLSRHWFSRIALGVGAFATAITIHTAWNLAAVRWSLFEDGGPLAMAMAALPVVYLLYVVVLFLFLHWEHRLLVRELGEEVELGVLPDWVTEVIPWYRRRVRGDWWPSRTERTVIARLLTRLAYRKHAIAHLPDEEARLAGLEVVRLRERARRILGTEDDGPTPAS